MASIIDPVNSVISSTADLRKASVEQNRAKNRKVRYRNVNVNLLNQPIDPLARNPNCKRWNERNMFKMPNPNTFGGPSCQCQSCRSYRWESNNRCKTRLQRAWDHDPVDGLDDLLDQDNIYRDGVDGVLYSYDLPSGPSHGSQVLSQALNIAIDKMERKQLELLIKNEYDVVDSEESASSEDDDYEFV
ncbi:hypothetical protein TWF173_009336 [Orbilia oligospora]|uniref:Uncharacterized protein n=2 Tax=Orbilia oligospora TaxID=2813651 RepID=G1X2Y6_ARTOA|nr:hypothetical protein AOL_s00043g59 [Orbilia oligospora ATCC 24927]EGX52270.1 hypothetical protein AOL_s00043g59 [Orbilia oligospora ATCC 24927]KAF3274011.1 hypothetical protein TWF970_008215 [Orbilia oligospora]KAF3310719.1 hypothetical protein TWF173_009336 [Orbilia oligospora]